jgi:hypothetical protein
VKDAVLLCILLCLFELHRPLVLEVTLAARQRDNNSRIATPLQLLHPLLRPGERILVRDIVYDDGCRRPAIVLGGHAAIPLLPSRVPNFEFHCRVIEGYRLRQKRRADRRFLKLKELIAHESHHQARFPHRRIPNKYQFEVANAMRCHGLRLKTCAQYERGKLN